MSADAFQAIYDQCQRGGFDFELALRTALRDGERLVRAEEERVMSRFDDNPAASVRAFLDSRKRPEPTAAELAASILGDYGFTADDILDGLAADGTITILPLGPDEEDQS